MIVDTIYGFIARLLFSRKVVEKERAADLAEARLKLHEAQKAREEWVAQERMLRARVARLEAAR